MKHPPFAFSPQRDATVAALLSLVLLGCGSEKHVTNSNPPPIAVAASASIAPAVSKVGPDYSEADFVENDRNRDPFRAYLSLFSEGQKRTFEAQRRVILSQYSLDELKLVAIVQGADYPRAMVVDPHRKGWVLKRGDFLCRAETVHTGGTNGTDYQVNWRVDRVREGDIVLIREDPAQPNIPPATRVIPLHPEALKASEEDSDDLSSESRL